MVAPPILRKAEPQKPARKRNIGVRLFRQVISRRRNRRKCPVHTETMRECGGPCKAPHREERPYVYNLLANHLGERSYQHGPDTKAERKECY